MRESRLFKIIYHLINNGQAAAEELAEMLEVGDSLLAVEPKGIRDELMNQHAAALKQLRIKEAEYEY